MMHSCLVPSAGGGGRGGEVCTWRLGILSVVQWQNQGTGTPDSSCRVRYSTHFCTGVEELGELLWTKIVAGSTQS